MTRYYIETTKCGVDKVGMGCGAEIAETKVKTDNGDIFYMSLAEVDGLAHIYKSVESTYDFQINLDFDNESLKKFHESFILGGHYEEVLADEDAEFYQLYRYLIYVVRANWEDTAAFIEETSGKYLDEIEIPLSDVEEEFREEEKDEDDDNTDYAFTLPTDKEELFKLRLGLETDVVTESVFHDMDYMAFKSEKAMLKAVAEASDRVGGYDIWKETYIAAELNKFESKKFLVCKYMFAGIGQYEIVIPEDELESFKCWIDGNGSAFMGSVRDADTKDIETYIALSAIK